MEFKRQFKLKNHDFGRFLPEAPPTGPPQLGLCRFMISLVIVGSLTFSSVVTIMSYQYWSFSHYLFLVFQQNNILAALEDDSANVVVDESLVKKLASQVIVYAKVCTCITDIIEFRFSSVSSYLRLNVMC